MDKQLEIIAKSYDTAIDLGRQGFPDQYSNLPQNITNATSYQQYKSNRKNIEGSERKQIKAFLRPNKTKKFVDLGCCLNLMLKGYDKWTSLYYGVDISQKTIELLKEYASDNNIKVGTLMCCGVHETPFEDHSFDIGACIGVLEYFDKEYVEKALIEFYRILKPNSKFVLDIPNIEGTMGRVMMSIENYIGRPDKFEMTTEQFETSLKKYFTIERKDKANAKIAMICYFLERKN